MSKSKKRLITIFSIIGVFIVLMIVFGALFKIRNITVDYATGIDRLKNYSQTEIVEKSGVKKGKNIIFTKVDVIEKKLEKNYPYAKFNIVRNFPNTVIIYMYERKPVFRIQGENNLWYVFDEELKCLAVVAEANLEVENLKAVPVLRASGIELVKEVGECLDNKWLFNKVDAVLDGFYAASQDVSVMSDITLSYDNNNLFDIMTLTMSYNGEKASKIVIQGQDFLAEKIAYAVHVYGSEITQNSTYSGKLDKVTITVLNNFNPNDPVKKITVAVNE